VYTVIPSYKYAINPIINPNPVYSHITRDNIVNAGLDPLKLRKVHFHRLKTVLSVILQMFA
jgi:hypothetical protein